MAKKINLTVDPMWQLLRRVTFPASIGSLFQTFYNLVDTFFAGKISPDALSALAKSFPIYFIIIAIGVGVGAGTNTLIGNSIGEKKEKIASLYVAQSIIFAIVISLLVTFIGINSSNYLLQLLGSSPENIILTREYLDIIFYCTVIVLIQISLNGTLNAQGDTKSYRNVLIFTFFLNIILNPIFIFGFSIIPAFGISGIAIATVICQLIGTIYLAQKVYCCKLKEYLYAKCFIPKINFLSNLTFQSVPIMFSMLLIGVGIFNVLYFVGKFGDIAAAGYGAALRIEQVFLLPVIALNTAVLSIGGQNFGARNFERIRDLYKKALIFGCSFMIMAGFILYFGAENLLGLITDDPETIKFGSLYLKIAALIGPIYPTFFITTAVFQALKRPIFSLYLSILRLTAIPFLCLWYVINIKGGGYSDIFYTILVTNWLMGLVVLFFIGSFFNYMFKDNKKYFFIKS